ncbi:MAG TPA: LptA/OstA family protein, partial [Terracidiphilus sp.]
VRFAPAVKTVSSRTDQRSTAEIESALLEGHVVLVRQPVKKAGAQAQAPLRATAGRADYQDAGETLRLTENPRVEDSGLQLTANSIDVSQRSGEAFAHGDVKATWLAVAESNGHGKAHAGSGPGPLGGQAPAHVVSDEARFNQSEGEAVFRGHARLWQDANSIAAPQIVLNREKQTLQAKTTSLDEPVVAVLQGTGDAAAAMLPGVTRRNSTGAQQGPSVIRVRGGQFDYADAEHRAVMSGATLGSVVAEAGGATCTAQEVVLLLRPRGTNTATAEVERVTASGDVVVNSQGRKGAGEKLVYTSLTGEYALTGTPEEPPRLTDPSRGMVTGSALIFNSRDDSVSIEGRGHETRMETTAPK